MLSTVLVLVSGMVIVSTHQITYEDSTASASASGPSSDLQQYTKECGSNYSLACLKADVVRLISLISRSPPVQIMPGISISSSGIRTSLNGFNRRTADDILAKALTDFFRSITIHVSLYNERASEMFSGNGSQFTARLKKYKFLTVYTVFAIAFALLSALVGKAMTLSIVSLIISMIARNGGIGFAPAASNSPPPQVYDIVRRPHIQFANTHSTEEIFEGARKMMTPTHDYSKIYDSSSSSSHPYTAYLHQDKTKIISNKNSTKLKS